MLTTVVVVSLGTVAFAGLLNFLVVMGRRVECESTAMRAGRTISAVLGVCLTWFACVGAILLLIDVL